MKRNDAKAHNSNQSSYRFLLRLRTTSPEYTMERASTTINFIQKDELYLEEKPYLLTYEAPHGFPRTNIKLDERVIAVEDVRGHENEFTINKNGFTIMQVNTKLSYEDFNDDDLVKQVYLKEVAEALKSLLGASRVQVFEHIVRKIVLSMFYYRCRHVLRVNQVRKRHPLFPISTGQPYLYNQPTSIAHIGMHSFMELIRGSI